MLSIRDENVIVSIIAHCNRIEEKTANISKEEFENNNDIKEIVCFNLFQIGELAKSLSNEFVETYSFVPWKEIKGMRDAIVHGYGTIKFEIVWNTVVSDVVSLHLYCSQILNAK